MLTAKQAQKVTRKVGAQPSREEWHWVMWMESAILHAAYQCDDRVTFTHYENPKTLRFEHFQDALDILKTRGFQVGPVFTHTRMYSITEVTISWKVEEED